MTNEVRNIALSSGQAATLAIPDLPEKIVCRAGFEIELSGDSWRLPLASTGSAEITFYDIKNTTLKKLFQHYLAERIQTVASATALNDYYGTWSWIIQIPESSSMDGLSESLIATCKNAVKTLRRENKLYRFYQLSRFYIWGALDYPEICFSEEYGYSLQAMRIPGALKNQAVLNEDEVEGPLHRVLELPQLIKALGQDEAKMLPYYQQRAAVALSVAFGLNPRMATYINEDDLIDLTPDAETRTYQLSLPRMKKGQLHPREDMRTVSVTTETAMHLLALIDANQVFGNKWSHSGKLYNLERRLFRANTYNNNAFHTRVWSDIFNFTSIEYTKLLKDFAERCNVISLVTNKRLNLNSRRMRYTFGTGLVLQGISPRGLAFALDHSDTQNVQAYFTLKEQIVEQLDEASKGKYANLTDFFNGTIIATDATRWDSQHSDKIDLVNEGKVHELGECGSNTLCGLNPPLSCYLCPLFRAYRFANHRAVLDTLLKNKDLHKQRYQAAGFQFDQLICVVVEVIHKCGDNDAS